jgi:hypothetical protein
LLATAWLLKRRPNADDQASTEGILIDTHFLRVQR